MKQSTDWPIEKQINNRPIGQSANQEKIKEKNQPIKRIYRFTNQPIKIKNEIKK
jgi:hypothetical protein